MNKKWMIAQAGFLILGALSIYLMITYKLWQLPVCLFGLHGVEYILFGKRVGTLAGIPAWKSLAYTLVLGLAWWIPKNDDTHAKIEAGNDSAKFARRGCGIRFVSTDE